MKHTIKKLSNGVRLITVPIQSSESATLTVWVNTGSRWESDKVSGISHFLEHMVFKGGKKRQTAKEIAEAVDAIGGEFNAATSKEWTNFYIKARVGNMDVAYDVLADMVLTPQLRQEDIDREKGVIVEEIGMYEDTPLWKIGDLFENIAYSGHSLGRDIIGTKETVTSFRTKDFEKYRTQHYSPQNIVITVAGGIDEKKILELTKKYFGSMKATSEKQRAKSKFATKQKKPLVLLSSKKKDQAHFILGFRTSEIDSPTRFSESLLATILGGGMSSRLFTEIREKRGLAYSVRGDRDCYTDVGNITVYAGVDPKKIEEAIAVTLTQCYGIVNNELKITEEELKKAKEYIKGHVALSLEDSKAIDAFYGVKELLVGKIESPEEVFEALEKTTIDDIVSVAKKFFKPERLSLAVIGPYKDSKHFEKLLS